MKNRFISSLKHGSVITLCGCSYCSWPNPDSVWTDFWLYNKLLAINPCFTILYNNPVFCCLVLKRQRQVNKHFEFCVRKSCQVNLASQNLSSRAVVLYLICHCHRYVNVLLKCCITRSRLVLNQEETDIWMFYCRTVVSSLRGPWRYCSLALSHQYTSTATGKYLVPHVE